MKRTRPPLFSARCARTRPIADHAAAINGVPSVDITDEAGAREGIVGLQVHASGPIEVRFRKFELELDPYPEDGLITLR